MNDLVKLQMSIMKLINKWKILTEDIADIFIREYFEIPSNEDVDIEWVSNDIGGVFEFADYFFSFADILECYKHNITREQLFKWYEYCLEEPYINISLSKFILSPEEKAKKELEILEISRKNLIFAQEEFNKAMERYGNYEL